MSILIKGMEMPTEGTVIAIYKLNGKFYASVHGTELCPLVEVPTPHGRLIDADELTKRWTANGDYPNCIYDGAFVVLTIDTMPTIIEAEE